MTPPHCVTAGRRRQGPAILSLLLLLFAPSSTQHLENDLSLLHDLDVNKGAPDDDFEVDIFYKPQPEEREKSSVAPASVEGDLRRLWGVADTEATLGRVFSYSVPGDAFSGHVESYEMKGLPSWLAWDGSKGVLEGVAGSADRGHHYITIRAVGRNGNIAKDVFAINVKEPSARSMRQEAGCKEKEDISVLSIVLNKAFQSLTPKDRIRILRAAAFLVGTKEVSLAAAPHDSDPLSEDAATLAGPGSSKLGQGRGGVGHSLVQLTVGCRGEVSEARQGRVDWVELGAKNGDFEAAFGVPVLGWHVTQVQPRTKRIRRQADYSGNYEEGGELEYNPDYYPDYDYYDYGDEADGDVLSAYDLEETIEPESRVVPPLATPVFPESSATPRPQDRGGVDGSQMHFTPVLVSTPVYVPVKPTRLVVEASPTVTYQTATPHQPTTTPSHTPHLEPSITTHPTMTAETTTPLSQPTPSTIAPTRPLEPVVEVSTEVGVKNFPPRVRSRIQKLAWMTGHVYRLAIPQDMFMDLEDGNTRNLRLLFKTLQGQSLGRTSWIQFNPTEQYIYALPLEEHIGRYNFQLEALDSEGESIHDTIHIHVQQPKEARNFNHRFTATFNIQKKYEYEFVYSLDWQIKAVEKIAAVYGDATTDLINVWSISRNPNKVTWTNTSLTDPRSNTCPNDEIEALAEVVTGGGEHGATREVKQAFEPEFNLKRVHLHYVGTCQRHPHPGHTPTRHGETESEGTEGQGGRRVNNIMPLIRNQIDFLNATQGSLFTFKVPLDTCYDTEDGDSSNLKMRLLTQNLSVPPNTSWLQFDSANQEFYGIPLAEDVGRNEYMLECKDSDGGSVKDALFVTVIPRPSKKLPPVQFSLTVADKYSDFIGMPQRKTKLIRRIGEAFGDEDARNVGVDSFRMGSVIVTWQNTSLPAEPCPNQEIEQLRDKMVTNDGDLKPEFVEFFSSEFKVLAGSVMPTGACLGEDTPTHIEEEVHRPPVGEAVEEEDNDYLLNFIIPAVIIAAMLLLAAIIACCLYRRRRYGKMTMADDSTFVSKGIPIIFAEELDDRPDPAKSPVIMKDEKPPLPPPEYQRGSSPPASAPTPPSSDRRRRPHSGEAADDAPSYQPPPPFTATNGASRHPRPNMPPTYRKPPTYVPP